MLGFLPKSDDAFRTYEGLNPCLVTVGTADMKTPPGIASARFRPDGGDGADASRASEKSGRGVSRPRPRDTRPDGAPRAYPDGWALRAAGAGPRASRGTLAQVAAEI